MFLVTASLLMMVPYFAYVFDFLDPDRVVGVIADTLHREFGHNKNRMPLQAIVFEATAA